MLENNIGKNCDCNFKIAQILPIPHKSLQYATVLLVANIVSNSLLVQTRIFTQKLGHFLGIKRRRQQAMLLEKFNSFLRFVIKLLSTSLENLAN